MSAGDMYGASDAACPCKTFEPIRHRLSVRPIVEAPGPRRRAIPRPQLCQGAPPHSRRKHKKRREKHIHGAAAAEGSPLPAQATVAEQRVPESDPRQRRMVQIPGGPWLEVPVGARRYRLRHAGYKYSLRFDPATGSIRHIATRKIE